MRALWIFGIAVLLLAGALPAWGDASEEDRHQAALQSVETAKADLVEARSRARKAEAAVRDARQRRKPRGEKLEELREELEEARADLARAEAKLPRLLEEARRAGTPPGLLRETEDWLDANPPANAP